MSFDPVGTPFLLDRVPIEEIHFPNHFKVIGRNFLESRSYYDITDGEGSSLGFVVKDFAVKEINNYKIENPSEQVVAKGEGKIVGLNQSVNLCNSSNELIGGLEQKVSRFFNEYKISAPIGDVIAVAQKNLTGTSFTLSDPSTKEIYATVSRSFFHCCRDSWTVNILKPDVIDPRLIVMIPAFEINQENRGRRAEVISNLVELARRVFSKEKTQ